MGDTVLIVLLFAFIWAAVLLGPAAGARASREAEFLGSIRPDDGDLDVVDQCRFRPALTANARRRQVLGGLVVAIGATLALGTLPPLRLLLFVHLLLVNSCLAYIGLLVRARDSRAAQAGAARSARWRDGDARPAPRFAEPVHPYAAADDTGYADDFAYQGDPWRRAEPASYADAAASGDGEAAARYTDDGWDEADDDAEAVAAYIDDELRLAQPA
jgi:hypothetical protein